MIAFPFSSPAERSSLQLERTGVTSQIQKSAVESEFWKSALHFRDTIVSKVREAGREDLMKKLAECQTQKVHITCTGCNVTKVAFNHCDLKYCPLCTPRLAAMRRESIEAWTKTIRQPKHVVLTMRNSETLTRRYVRSGQAAVSKLRRSVFAREWKGGLVSTELTNEGRGWHLHYHLLVDARFIDNTTLAQKWAQLVGQDFAIVKVKDAREKTYLQEVTKYAVKGSELASWTGEDILKFIFAFTKVRTFQTFGSCFKLRAEIAAFREQVKDLRKKQCACGCTTKRVTPQFSKSFQSPHEMNLHEQMTDWKRHASIGARAIGMSS